MQIFLEWKIFKGSMQIREIREQHGADTQICSLRDRVGRGKGLGRRHVGPQSLSVLGLVVEVFLIRFCQVTGFLSCRVEKLMSESSLWESLVLGSRRIWNNNCVFFLLRSDFIQPFLSSFRHSMFSLWSCLFCFIWELMLQRYEVASGKGKYEKVT